jgi:chromosome segregation ATPase
VSSGVPETDPLLPAEWNHLELVVRRLLDQYAVVRRRAGTAERRLEQLERTVKELSAGELDPQALRGRVHALEAENRELAARLAEARERVERIQARLRFLEESR